MNFYSIYNEEGHPTICAEKEDQRKKYEAINLSVKYKGKYGDY